MGHNDQQPSPPAPEPIPNESTTGEVPAGQPETGAAGPAAGPFSPPPRVLMLGATALLSGCVLLQVPTLWNEWQGLRKDWEQTRQTEPIGFVNISPDPSYARPPQPWIVPDGDSMLLWSGWVENTGHSWFRVHAADLDPKTLGQPLGRDVVRAIDVPMVEVGGGELWERLQPDTPIVGLTLEGTPTAYPMLLLSKVEVVNDTIRNHPVLVVATPFVSSDQAVDLYNPVLDGKRIQFGLSGYFVVGQSRPRPLLYDRDTESLWLVRDHELTCLAGVRKGKQLRHIGHGSPVNWSAWVARYPDSRLLIGADRSSPPIPRITAAEIH